MEQVYRIPSENLGLLNDRLDKLNKRAKKLGVESVKVNNLGFEDIQSKDQWDRPITHRFYNIEVIGETPKIAGWRFIATLEHAGEAGTIVRVVPGCAIPDQYRDASPEDCDYCHLKRRRLDTYVVQSTETPGLYKQVGSACLVDFLGGADPKKIAASAQYLMSIDEVFRGYTGSFGARESYLLVDYLAYVVESVRRFGWLSKAKAYEKNADPTSFVAWNEMTMRPGYNKKYIPWHPTEDAVEAANEILDWARETLSTKATLNDFEYNLKVVCASDEVTDRRTGLAAAIYIYWKMATTERQEREQRPESNYVGAVGKKLQTAIKVLKCTEFSGSYGLTTAVTMIDNSGNILSWFASGSKSYEKDIDYMLTGTVKDHRLYKGQKQTLLNRCQLERV